MTGRSVKVVFFGTTDFSVVCLEALIRAGHQVLAVVTQPDRPRGRGHQVSATPVKAAALRHAIPVLQPRRVRSEAFIARIREMAPEVLALAAFGQIVPQALLDIPPLGPINVHGSLLPKYRGAAPIQRAIMAGETETGITTMWMDATLDTGDILLAASIAIEPDDNSGTLFPKLAALGADLLVQTLEGLLEGTVTRRRQDDSLASLAPAIQPEESAIRWTEPAVQTNNRIRGLTPKPGAFAAIQGKRVKVLSAAPLESTSDQHGGTILAIQRAPAGLLVAAGEGTALLLREVQPDSGKRMAAADWARGLRLAPGERFETI